ICSFWADKNGNADEEINRIIYRNKLRYRDSGYNLFHFDTGSGWPDNNYLAVAKGKTDIDILRWRGTNGTNPGIDNDALIAKVEEWQRRYDLVLWGCGADWMRIFFIHEAPEYLGGTRSAKWYEQSRLWDTRTPKFRKFAEEVIEFCPDLVLQVYKNKTALIKEMERVNGVYFWWD
ncbi:MAG: DUF4253 domain-containing protein, partial [Alistipes sp.]|nr:DUF4253 domain-containing protein [Alistipes sp.]